jgi:hypothetical protein
MTPGLETIRKKDSPRTTQIPGTSLHFPPDAYRALPLASLSYSVLVTKRDRKAPRQAPNPSERRDKGLARLAVLIQNQRPSEGQPRVSESAQVIPLVKETPDRSRHTPCAVRGTSASDSPGEANSKRDAIDRDIGPLMDW